MRGISEEQNQADRELFRAFLKQWRQKFGYLSMFAALPAIVLSQAQDVRADEAADAASDVSAQIARFSKRLGRGCSSKPALLQRNGDFRLPRQKLELDTISVLTGGDGCPGAMVPAGIFTASTPFIDSGDTTGASNTIVNASCFPDPYGYGTMYGPDHIYSFRLIGRGANPSIQLINNSSTYNPEIYILTSCAPESCLVASSNSGPGGNEIIGSALMNALPLNVPLHLVIDSFYSEGPPSAGPYTIRMQDVTVASARASNKRSDFDGDFRADLALFRPSDATWYMVRTQQGFGAVRFGLSGDRIVPGDFDGDGKTDIAVYRDGTWYWIHTATLGTAIVQFGLDTDIPVPADFSGDGGDELAVYRDGQWWILNLITRQISVTQFGVAGDRPVVADYDGDGRADQAVYRNGQWHLNRSTQGYAVINWGLPSDTPVIGDYDGDLRSDPAVYRNGTWYVLGSSSGPMVFPWGLATDIPVPGDYDGDGKTDAAVYREGLWYLLQTTSGISIQRFGLSGDKPAAAAYIP